MAIQKRSRYGFCSNWAGGILAWYYPDEKLLVWINKDANGGLGESVHSLPDYRESTFLQWEKNHQKRHNGKRFGSVSEGVRLTEEWLNDEPEPDNEDA